MSKFDSPKPTSNTGSSSNQTLAFLLRRFKEVGISPVHQLGQNFLIDLNIQRLLIRRAAIDKDDIILEVGTGTGSMSVQMAPLCRKLITVELDEKLFALSQEDLSHLDNIEQLNVDILKNKNALNPVVLEAIENTMAENPGCRLKLAANLPYAVATPIISNLMRANTFSFGVPYSMTVTIQKEMGDRIIAAPGSKDFCALSLWMQAQCDVETTRIIPPSVFWPRPKVYSAIVHMQTNLEKRNAIPDLEFFHQYAKALFLHRRKFLRSELITAYKDIATKADVDAVMEKLGLDGTARAEAIPLSTHLQLCEAMRQLQNKNVTEP